MKKLYSLLFVAFLISFSIQAQDEFYNDGADVKVEDNAEVYVEGNVKNKNSGKLTNNGLIELSGDYTNDATYDFGGSGTRTIRFKNPDLNDPQYASGNLNFYNLEIDNPRTFFSGSWTNGGLILNDNVTVKNKIDLKTPNNNTTNSKILTNGNLITLENGSPSSIENATGSGGRYILLDGNNSSEGLKWKIGGTNSYSFPIGTEEEAYTGFTLDFSSTPSNEYIKARFEEVSDPGGFGPTSGFSNSNWFSHIVTCDSGTYAGQEQWIELSSMIQEYGVWDITPSSSGGWNYDIKIDAKASPSSSPTDDGTGDFQKNDPVTSYPYVFHKLIKTNNSISSSYEWNDDVWNSGHLCAGSNSVSSLDGLKATGLSSFSKFGVAGNSDTQLPIELLDLQANGVDNEYIAVTWTTATELNNKGFEVHRRTEDSEFEKIGWVDGNGTIQDKQHYSFDDYNVEHNKVYYYRLKQIDFNGNFDKTKVVTAMIEDGNVFTISDFIPNPSTENSKIMVNTSEEKDLQIRLYNTLGQVISDRKLTVQPGSNAINFSLDDVADGTYHAIINVNNEVFNRKLVITKN